MKKFVMAIVAGIFLICCGCNTEGKTTPSTISNGIELSVEPDEYWLGKIKVFIFSIDKTPQMAAWIEDNNGQYISTMIVTNRSGKNKWRSAPKEGRPEALPVWNHKIQNNITEIDSASSATPKGTVVVQIDNSSLINGQEYNVYLEINHSFDYNDRWPEKEDDVNGQPSIIYTAKFIAGTAGKIKLNPIGHGSENASDGNIVQRLDGLTSALTIIKEANIIIN